MARYADIDVLLEHLTASDEGNFRTAITQWLEMHQAEDVAPVVHAKKVLRYYAVDLGRYIPKEDVFLVNSMIKNIPFCGNCDEQLIVPCQKYCHNCGAIMDGEVE